MAFILSEFLDNHRQRIIDEWVRRLHSEVSVRYSDRPVEELMETVTQAYEANCAFLLHDDLTPINYFIKKITKMRLEAGFPLSDVQKAFELFRKIVIPLIGAEADSKSFQENVVKINQCLAYTIHRFSDWFQAMHERAIREYSKDLEKKVRLRTAEMLESELKYRRLVEEISEGYLVVRNHVIVFTNKAFCEMHGYSLNEVLGKDYRLFVDPEDREMVSEFFELAGKADETVKPFDYLRLTKDGRGLPTEMNLKATTYQKRPSTLCLCRDITWRVKMEERLRETERMTYIGQITASLSHEIRNPLSAVKMNLQILNRNPQFQGNDRRRVEISIREVIRLEKILKELLDFAKPVQIRPRGYDVNQIMRACMDLLEAKCKEKDLRVITSLDPTTPKVEIDGEKMSQVFINLILNAIEASRERGEIFVCTRFVKDGDSPVIDIAIEDQGEGIPKERQTEIFKPFYTTKSTGTGLGLSIAKRIVEAHEGRITVENTYPTGATFRVTLPIRRRPWQRY